MAAGEDLLHLFRSEFVSPDMGDVVVIPLKARNDHSVIVSRCIYESLQSGDDLAWHCLSRYVTIGQGGCVDGEPDYRNVGRPRAGSCGDRSGTAQERPTTGAGTIEFACRSHHQPRSEEHTSELQSLRHLVCRLLLEK